jgi:hypothetical protein
MRYFVPRLKIATLAKEQGRLLSKIGGLPWGLPADSWPSCCGYPQKLVAQLCHEPPMLDLGGKGAVLHLFQCLECCGINEKERAAFLVDHTVLGSGLRRIEGYDRVSEYAWSALIGEAWIEGWEEYDDDIPELRLVDFYDEKKLWALQEEFSKIKRFEGRQFTKFGGSPRWTGWGPMGFPLPPFEFLFQLNNDLYIDGLAPNPDDVGCQVWTFSPASGKDRQYTTVKPKPGKQRANAPWGITHEPPDPYFSFEFTNLGSDGVLYVFIDRTRQPHGVRWFWNR